MYSFDLEVRVRYSETDRMGFVYYGNYAQYYEIGRVETFRSLGFSYKDLEDSGINLPVLNLKSQFIKPAYYDDLLKVRTIITELPGLKINFRYEIFNAGEEMINIGHTTLVFYNKMKRKPCLAPNWMIEKLRPYYNKQTEKGE